MNRINILILISALLLINTAGSATDVFTTQSNESINDDTISLIDFLYQLGGDHQVKFAYQTEQLRGLAISKEELAKAGSLDEILQEILTRFSLSFTKIDDQNYVIKKSNEKQTGALIDNGVSESQELIEITGRITDETGEGLPGVNIIVKGSYKGTVTDFDGEFNIEVESDAILTVTFIGYETVDVAVNGRTNIDVQLRQDIEQLEEIVVIGYGEQKKADLTSAITTVRPEQINRAVAPNFSTALQGQAPGVSVVAGGGPGAEGKIQIRGVGSVNGTDPLFVVDGVPMQDSPNVSPHDIASIQVLKDASSTAIYGSRGANGVIIITTNRGRTGEPTISLTGYRGVQQIPNRLEMLDAQQFATFNKEVSDANGSSLPNRVNDILDNPDKYGKGTDWQEEMFQVARIQNYHASVSGGMENLNYSVSGGYLDQEGTIINSGYQRYNFTVNTDLKKGKFQMGESLILSKEDWLNKGGAGILKPILRQTPAVSVYNSDLLGGFDGPTAADLTAETNPVGNSVLNTTEETSYRVTANLYAQYEILSGLKYKANFGLNYGSGDEMSRSLSYDMNRVQNNETSLSLSDSKSFYRLMEHTLNYSKQINDHNFSALLGYTQEVRDKTWNIASAEGFTVREVESMALKRGDAILFNDGGLESFAMESYLARILYNFDDRYYVTANVRRDGSSRFGSNNRFGNFPSASVGWNISNESFFNLPKIDMLKLRSSYGAIGFQGIAEYEYFAVLTTNANYVFNNNLEQGIAPTKFANEDLKWETTLQFDLGLDIEAFRNKLVLGFDFYQKNTQDMLINIPIATIWYRIFFQYD